mmetsp:Transcript_12479/g.42186  ORF Transcript_12479/g.42186 Transcript_12479/m.42186 type:complete len:404 (-) Transcript_12479:115-1326(-)
MSWLMSTDMSLSLSSSETSPATSSSVMTSLWSLAAPPGFLLARGAPAAAPGETDELGQVDITTPLQPDEVMPIARHYEAPQVPASSAGAGGVGEDDAAGAPRKRSTKKKKAKAAAAAAAAAANGEAAPGGEAGGRRAPRGGGKKKRRGGAAAADEVDLLDMGGGAAPASPAAEPPVWWPALEAADMTLSLAAAWDEAAGALTLSFRAVGEGVAVATVGLRRPPSGASAPAAPEVALSPAGDGALKGALVLPLHDAAAAAGAALEATLRYESGSSLLGGPQEVACQLRVPAAALLRPVAVTEVELAEALGGPTAWVEAQARVRLAARAPKASTRRLAEFMNAHRLAVGSATALSARGPGGERVLATVKKADNGQTLKVDMKVTGGAAAQPLAAALAADLAPLVL